MSPAASVAVTLPAALLTRLRSAADGLQLPLEWVVAALIAAAIVPEDSD